MIEPGRYRARPRSWALGETSAGKPQIAVEMALSDASLGIESLTWYGYFSEGALEIAIKALHAMGWEGIDLGDFLDSPALDTAKEVEIVVENEAYEGRVYARVKFINSIREGVALRQQMTPASVRAFAATMRGAIAAIQQQLGQAQPRQAQPRQAAAPTASMPTPAPAPASARPTTTDKPPSDRWPTLDDDQMPF